MKIEIKTYLDSKQSYQSGELELKINDIDDDYPFSQAFGLDVNTTLQSYGYDIREAKQHMIEYLDVTIKGLLLCQQHLQETLETNTDKHYSLNFNIKCN